MRPDGTVGILGHRCVLEKAYVASIQQRQPEHAGTIDRSAADSKRASAMTAAGYQGSQPYCCCPPWPTYPSAACCANAGAGTVAAADRRHEQAVNCQR